MKRIKENRSLLVYLLLSVLTLGIYAIWHQNRMISDINRMLKSDGKRTAGVGWLILLFIPTLTIYSLVWHYKIGKRLNENLMRWGVPSCVSGGGLTALIFFSRQIPFLSLIAEYKMIHATNRLARYYNRVRFSE